MVTASTNKTSSALEPKLNLSGRDCNVMRKEAAKRTGNVKSRLHYRSFASMSLMFVSSAAF